MARSPHRTDRLTILDGLRGLAALYVCLSHARYLLHEGLKDGYLLHPETYSFSEKIAVHALGFFGWGHEAVILFFVLSGFAIHYRYAKEMAAHGLQAKLHVGNYLWRRAKRLYPPLLLALGLTLGLDALGAAMHLQVNPAVGPVNHDFRTLLGNLAFTMDLNGHPVSTFGTNTPLWSLRYEAAFYLLYPLLWFAGRRSAWLAATAAWIPALIFALLPWLADKIPGLILQPLKFICIWWLGGLLADVLTRRLPLPMAWLGGLVLCFPLGIRLPGQEHALFPEPLATLMVGFGCAGLIALGLACRDHLARWRLVEWLGKTGDFSYTLYVLHMPILVLLGGWLSSRTANGRPPTNPAWVIPGTLLCVLLAYAAHFLVERPFLSTGTPKPGTRPA